MVNSQNQTAKSICWLSNQTRLKETVPVVSDDLSPPPPPPVLVLFPGLDRQNVCMFVHSAGALSLATHKDVMSDNNRFQGFISPANGSNAGVCFPVRHCCHRGSLRIWSVLQRYVMHWMGCWLVFAG